MSIRDRLIELEALDPPGAVRFVPTGRRPPLRRLFLVDKAIKDFNDPASAVNLLAGHGFVESAMARWTLGDLVYGDKRKGRFLSRLDPPPPEVWEMRVTEPTVQARLFGRFGEPDTLILSRFHTRPMLGDKGPAWDQAMAETVSCWNRLFPNDPPFSGPDIHSYVTENCDVFPI